MITPKNKDLTRFVRFGGVSLKKQAGWRQEPKGFHAPPAPRGFYAMPKVAQDHWLISSMSSYQPGTVPKTRAWDPDTSSEEIESFDKRTAICISRMRKEFSKKTGSIWHHLEKWTELSQIESRHGAWVRTPVQAWQKAFSKMSLESRYSGFGERIESINSARGLLGLYGKDFCEVFIDEKP
jgi:hypothetical protein